MVGWISNWAKGIIMAVIIATIIEMILPEGKNKKYIKLVIGVYILFSIITPIVSAIKGKDFEFDPDDYEKYFNTTYQVTSNELTKSNDNNIEKIYTENIKTDIKQKLSNKGYKVNELEIEINTREENYGNINKITMKIDRSDREKTKTINDKIVNKIEINNNTSNKVEEEKSNVTNLEIKELKEYLSNTYSIAEKYIQIN